MEALQKARGFKTYRDVYAQRVAELETQAKNLREKQKLVREQHEPNMHQRELFQQTYNLLQAKLASLSRGQAAGGSQQLRGQVAPCGCRLFAHALAKVERDRLVM